MSITVHYEESSEIVLDSESVTPETGWTFGYGSINRVGGLIALHIEATFASAAAAAVAVLPEDFRPAATVTDPTGKFTIAANGDVTFVPSTASGASATLQVVYQAATLTP